MAEAQEEDPIMMLSEKDLKAMIEQLKAERDLERVQVRRKSFVQYHKQEAYAVSKINYKISNNLLFHICLFELLTCTPKETTELFL